MRLRGMFFNRCAVRFRAVRLSTMGLCTLGLAVLSCVLVPRLAVAQISLSDVIVHFKAGERPIRNVTVRNQSEDPIFVTVEADQVFDPGADKPDRKPTEKLLVAPRMFSIDANGERTVRVLLKQPSKETEEIYRVKFLPQLRDFDVEKDSRRVQKTMIKVLTGMGVLIFSDPAKPVSKLTWERKGNTITFTNEGNRNIRISEGEVCDGSGTCTPIPGRRIYAGYSFEVDAPSDRVVKYLKQDGYDGNIEIITVDPVG